MSDEATLALSPSAGTKPRRPEKGQKNGQKQTETQGKAVPKPKAKPKADAKPKEPKPKSVPTKPEPVAKKGPVLNRPASSAGSAPAMKKPAKDPDAVSVCTSLYKRDGVWSVKLNQKEVLRAQWLHVFESDLGHFK